MVNQHEILDAVDIKRILNRMALEILETRRRTEDLALVGIHSRGVYLAKRLQTNIYELDNVQLATGDIDITLYRDDWTQIDQQPIVKATEIPFSVDGKEIILVDDVLFTGRTIRAAMDALIDFGRPNRIELAVLIDRGHRELPIQGNYTGKYVKTKRSETINVLLSECDGEDRVVIEEG